MLHPRDSHGRFRKKWKMAQAVVDAIQNLLEKFNPRTFGSQNQANQYLHNLSQTTHGKMDVGRFMTDFHHTNAALRAGQMDPSTAKFVKMMDDSSVTLPNDIIASKVVGADAFGLDAQSMHAEDGGLEDWTGRLIADRGYSMTNIGPELPNKKPGQITMRIAVPAGTKVNLPRKGQNDSGVVLGHDQELRVTKVTPDGVGGYYMLAVATNRTPGQTPTPIGGHQAPSIGHAEREANVRALQKMKPSNAPPEAPLSREQVAQNVVNPPPTQTTRFERSARLGQPQEPSPTGPTNTGPNGPAPRQEPIAHPGIGTAGGGATRTPTGPENVPEHAPVQPQSLDFRRAARNANLEPPSNGPRRNEWRRAYEGVANGKKNPEDVLRELEKDIDVNQGKLDAMEARGENLRQADPLLRHDIQRQQDLADLIRREHGLGPRPKTEAPKAAPAKRAAKKAAPKASVTSIENAPSKRGGTGGAPKEPSAPTGGGEVVPIKKAAKAATPRGGMTAVQARRQAALDSIDKNQITGDGSKLQEEIRRRLDSGEMTPTQAKSAFRKAERAFNESHDNNIKNDNPEGAKQAADTAAKFRKLGDELQNSQAAENIAKVRAAAPAPVKAAKKAAPGAPKVPEPKVGGDELDDKTAVDLKAIAKSEGVRGYSTMNKDKLKEAIRAKRTGGAPEAPAPAKKAATAAKKAVAPAGKPDLDALHKELEGETKGLPNLSREEANQRLDNLSRADLLDLAKRYNVPRASTLNKEALRREIVDASVGRKLDSIATRGFTGNRPGEGGIPGREPFKVPTAQQVSELLGGKGVTGGPEPIPEKATVSDLRKIAGDEGVDLKGKRLKADIRQAIEDKRAGKVPEAPVKKAAAPTKAATKAAKAAPVKKAAAATPIQAPDRKRDFTDDFADAKIDIPNSAAGRTMEEIRDDVAVGHITPNQGIERLENDISLNKQDLADLKAEYRRLGNIHELPVRDAEQKRLTAEAKRLREDIAAQEKMATFMHGHFQKAPEVTPDEVKKALTPTQQKALEKASPWQMKRAAELAGLGKLEGDTKEAVWNNFVKAAAAKAGLSKPVQPASPFQIRRAGELAGLGKLEGDTREAVWSNFVKVAAAKHGLGHAPEKTSPFQMRRAADMVGLGKLDGDTKEAVWNNFVKAAAAKLGLPGKPTKKVALPKAPEVPKADLPESPYKRIDVDALAEGLNFHRPEDKKFLARVQDLLDGKDERLGKNPTPKRIADDIEQAADGPVSRLGVAKGRHGTAVHPFEGETGAEHKARLEPIEQELADAQDQATQMMMLADRLKNTRRVRKEHAPEVRTTEPKLAAPEKADIAKVAEATGIPESTLQKKALAKKVAEAPPKANAQQVAETLKTINDPEEARKLLEGRTKADLMEIGKARGRTFPASATKGKIVDGIVGDFQAKANSEALQETVRGVKPTGKGYTRAQLDDMNPGDLVPIEEQLGIKRTSMLKSDRIDSILEAQANVPSPIKKTPARPTTRSKAVIPEAQTKIATQERKDGIRDFGDDLRKLTGDGASKTALSRALENRLKLLEKQMDNKQVREDVQPVLDAVKAGDNDRALRLMGEVDNVHGIKRTSIAQDLKALEAKAATEAKAPAKKAARVAAPKPTGSSTAGRLKAGDTISLKTGKEWRDPQKVTKVERVTIPRQGGKSSASGVRITREDGSIKDFAGHQAFHTYGEAAPEAPAPIKAAAPVKKATKAAQAAEDEQRTIKGIQVAAKGGFREEGQKLSDKPLLENHYGGTGGEINYHEDGAVGVALDRMGQSKRTEVNGEPLYNEAGKLVTQSVRGNITTEQLIDGLKELRQRVKDERAARYLDDAIKDIDSPKVKVNIPEDAPAVLRELVEALERNPLTRKPGRNGAPSEVEKALKIIHDFKTQRNNDPKRLPLIQDQVHKLLGGRHESEEGWYEARRAIMRTMEQLRGGK